MTPLRSASISMAAPARGTLTITPADPNIRRVRAAVVIADRAPVVLTTQLETFDLHAGRPIPVRATLDGAVAERVELTVPGSASDGPIPMRRADDGAWIGAFVAPAGDTTITVAAYGVDPTTPLRTTAHRLTIVDRTLELTGVGIVETPRRHDPQWTIWLDTRWRSAGERVMLGAELWGRGIDGAPTCVTWAGGYAEPDAHGALPLAIHDAWFDRVDVAPPYELRNVRVQHATSFVPIDTCDVIPLDGLDRHSDPARGDALTPPSAAMLAGDPQKRRVTVDAPSAPVTLSDPDGQRALVLVHGYCSDGSPWRATDFSGAVAAFRDPEARIARTMRIRAEPVQRDVGTALLRRRRPQSGRSRRAAPLHVLLFGSRPCRRRSAHSVGRRAVPGHQTRRQRRGARGDLRLRLRHRVRHDVRRRRPVAGEHSHRGAGERALLDDVVQRPPLPQ